MAGNYTSVLINTRERPRERNKPLYAVPHTKKRVWTEVGEIAATEDREYLPKIGANAMSTIII